jgi:hypothetical protein
MGPYSPFAHGSAFPSIEHVSKYLLRLIHKMQIENYKAVEPKVEALHDFINHADTFLQQTVLASRCRSWFKGGKCLRPYAMDLSGGCGSDVDAYTHLGKEDAPPMVHPGSRIHWFHMLEEPRWEDWNWTSQNANRFAYLGNGFSSLEDEGRDKAWYLDPREHESYPAIRY